VPTWLELAHCLHRFHFFYPKMGAEHINRVTNSYTAVWFGRFHQAIDLRISERVYAVRRWCHGFSLDSKGHATVEEIIKISKYVLIPPTVAGMKELFLQTRVRRTVGKCSWSFCEDCRFLVNQGIGRWLMWYTLPSASKLWGICLQNVPLGDEESKRIAVLWEQSNA